MFFAPSYFYYICASSVSDFDPMGVGRGPDSSSIATWGKTGTMSTLQLQSGGLV
jgi:hypothetical protein